MFITSRTASEFPSTGHVSPAHHCSLQHVVPLVDSLVVGHTIPQKRPPRSSNTFGLLASDGIVRGVRLQPYGEENGLTWDAAGLAPEGGLPTPPAELVHKGVEPEEGSSSTDQSQGDDGGLSRPDGTDDHRDPDACDQNRFPLGL